MIYVGETILGRITIGRITIGRGSTIGGNVWLIRDVPPTSMVRQATARNVPSGA
ncbi:hypothetical protein [Bradyrhizobium sp. SSUT18]|uniref:hypothetical protein n=1 Tax=Bradyrhizobium sp. SSUT18 TaxID=3040602 RepID=UPI0032660F3A